MTWRDLGAHGGCGNPSPAPVTLRSPARPPALHRSPSHKKSDPLDQNQQQIAFPEGNFLSTPLATSPPHLLQTQAANSAAPLVQALHARSRRSVSLSNLMGHHAGLSAFRWERPAVPSCIPPSRRRTLPKPCLHPGTPRCHVPGAFRCWECC